jgi:hypothetical protein
MTSTSNTQQDKAIERANEALAAAGLPLYGDVSGALARILSLLESPDQVGRRGVMQEAVDCARALYGAFPMFDPEAPRPIKLVNRAFAAMPYGGGIGFEAIGESDTKDAAYIKIAGNLDRLTDTLRAVATDHDKHLAELAEHRTAIKGVAIAFELIDRDRQRRAGATR